MSFADSRSFNFEVLVQIGEEQSGDQNRQTAGRISLHIVRVNINIRRDNNIDYHNNNNYNNRDHHNNIDYYYRDNNVNI